jgi:cysteine-rich repeat protein
VVVLLVVAAGCYTYHLPGDTVSDTADGDDPDLLDMETEGEGDAEAPDLDLVESDRDVQDDDVAPEDVGPEDVEVEPECGNGIVEAGEECDDGHGLAGDGSAIHRWIPVDVVCR